MDPHLRRDPQYQNFVTVYRGFAYVGKVLEPYTRAGLQSVHQKAYRIAAAHPPCLQQCSRLHGGVTIRWCAACKTWMNALVQNRRGQFRNWENTESWNWPGNFETLASVFLPTFWTKDGAELNEFGTACHIWSSCKECNISNALLKKLRELRNKEVGHNPILRVVDAEKTRVFDTLKTLLRENDVQAHINVGQCIQDLDSIAAGDELKDWIDEIEERIDANFGRQAIRDTCLAVCLSKVSTDTMRQNEILGAINSQLQHIRRNQRIHVTATFILSASIAAITVIGLLSFARRQDKSTFLKNTQNEECLSEMYSHPFPQDLPLLPYIEEHSKLFGRNWLFREIAENIQHTSSSDKGILITADMGYGKSAIVKHILCAGKGSEAHQIRSRIVAFHLCRFDVPSTKDPLRFLYRLVGFLSTRFPEFGGIISTLPESALLFDNEKCKKEIEACFDQGVLHPLLNMKILETGAKVIVIDAVDECFDTRTKNNELFILIKARYRKLPKWIKFMITSRNISLIHNLMNLKVYHLNSNDQRNTDDIKQYVQYKTFIYPNLLNVERTLDIFLEKSEGNFLFIVHLMDYLIMNKTSESIMNFPDTLSGVYEMNFERFYDSATEYDVAKSILEIIIASLHPLNKYELKLILENVNVSDLDTTDKNLEKLSFCFRSMQEITLVHQSFEAWLLSEDSRQFRISVQSGHAMLSRYLLNHVNQSHADIVDVAIHVGKSNDHTLIKAFAGTYSPKHVSNSTLHRLVWKSDSVAALEVIINLGVSVDTLNKGNVTASFVASARGRLHQLQLLKSKGASLNFDVNDSYLITSSEQIEVIKHDYYFGYGLIHIATQFGHLEISKFLIKQNKTVLHSTNGLGLSVAEIACETGRLNMLLFYVNNKVDVGRCLYYAAKNGHTHIIDKLAELGVNVSCISQIDALKAFEKLKSIDTSKTVFFVPPEGSEVKEIEIFSLNDHWDIVNQRSPLHAAITYKFTDTAAKLIEYYPQLIECVDAFGMTPFLLSAFRNETIIFERLLERVKTDTCQNVSTILSVESFLNRPVCPVGGSYVHLDGIYGRFDLTVILLAYRRQIDIDWFMPDNYSLSAAHYAACSGNTLFLLVIKRITDTSFSDIKSYNQSTPFHSAAICGSLGALFAMTDSFKSPVPDVVDFENRTVLHYTVLREILQNPPGLNSIQHTTSSHIFIKVLECGVRIKHSDFYMRNVLHYALKNGHFFIVRYLYENKSMDIYVSLLKQKDINGYSPVKYAIKKSQDRHSDMPLLVPLNCSFYHIFFADCGIANIENYLDSWELGLVVVLQTVARDVADDFINNLKDIILKSPYLTSAVLVYLKDIYTFDHVQSQVIESIHEFPRHESMYAVAGINPKLFIACGKLLSLSPLHLMAYTLEFDAIVGDLFQAFSHSGLSLDYNKLFCTDSRGYNIFHYSLMGGNIIAANKLFNSNVPSMSKQVSLNDIFWMTLLGKKRNIIFTELDVCSDQLTCIDFFFKIIFIKHVEKLRYSDFCLNNSALFSLIHIMAASGLKDSITLLHKQFGRELLECRNKDRITPSYLWNLLNNKSFSDTFQLTTNKVPYLVTEELLLFGLLNDFPLVMFESNTVSCLWNGNSNINWNMLKCFIRVQNYFKQNRFYFSKITVSGLRITNNIMKYLLNAKLQFGNALYLKHCNISNALAEVKVWVGVFRVYLKPVMEPFNYPRLNSLVLHSFKDTHCKETEQKQIKFECIQLFNELKHLVHRLFAYMRKDFTFEYLDGLKSKHKTLTEDFNFIRKRMEKFNYHSRKTLVYRESRLVLGSEEFIFSNKHDRLVKRHHYLNLLKKTVKYKHVKDKIRHISLFDVPLVTSKYLDFKMDIPKPFEDIFNYINSSSYSHVLKDLH